MNWWMNYKFTCHTIFLHGIRAWALVRRRFGSVFFGCEQIVRDGWARKIAYPTIWWKQKVGRLKLPTLEVQNEGNPERIRALGYNYWTDAKPANVGQQIVPTADEILAWTRKDVDALCSIFCSVSDSVMALIQHVTTVEVAWMVLKNQYETTNQTQI